MNIRLPAIPGLVAACLLLGLAPLAIASPADPTSASPAAAKAAAYWTKDRRAAAVPRDLRIDARGLGYMRRPDGRQRVGARRLRNRVLLCEQHTAGNGCHDSRDEH